MPLAEPRSVLRDVMRRCFKEPELLTVDQWADRYTVLPDYSPRPGPWRTIVVQYLRQPMRDFTDPAVHRIVMMTGTQIGKSELFARCLFYSIACDPGPAMYLMDSQDQAQNFMKDRIRPSLEASPVLRPFIPHDRSDKQIMRYRFDTMALYLAGAGSAGQLAAKSIRFLFNDEIDKWPQVLGGRGGTEDAALNVARSRLHAFGDGGKELDASSPTEEGVGIAKEFNQSERHEFYVPCPHCSAYQLLRFKIDGKGGLRWEGGSGAKLNDQELMQHCDAVRRGAWYECEACGEAITSEHKPRMIALGVWLIAGQSARVTDHKAFRAFDPFDGEAVYHGVVPPHVEVLGEKASGGVRGYHISQLISPFVTFGQIAEEFVRERGQITRAFVNQRLGEPWKQSGAKAAEGQLIELARQTPEGEESYRKATVPVALRQQTAKGPALLPGVLAMLGTIDVQQLGVYYVVRGYGAREETWLIDWGFVEWPQPVDTTSGELLQPPDPATATEQDLARWATITQDASAFVCDLMRRKWPTVRPAGGERTPGAVLDDTMAPQFWGVDSGDRTPEVYALVETMGVGSVFAMKGAENIKTPIRLAVVGDDAAAEQRSVAARLAAGAGVQLLEFQNLYWKDELFTAMWRRPPTYACFRWPVDLDTDYDRQMGAEHRVPVKLGRSIRDRYQWERRPGRRDNHYWDCEVMQRVLARHLGVSELATPAAAPVRGPVLGEV